MSLSAIASDPSTSLPTVNFHPHGHRKGARPSTSTASSTSTSSPSSTSSTSSSLGNTSGITIGQLPVGGSTPLFSNLMQSLQQTAGAATAVSAATPGSAAVPASLSGATTAGTAATSAVLPGKSSNQLASPGLQNALNTLLQNLQSGSVHSLSGVGNNINTKA